jgi:hypothetical protein
MNQQRCLEPHLVKGLGEATASLLLLEEDAAALAKRLEVGASDDVRDLLRRGAMPMRRAADHLSRIDPPMQKPELKNSALRRLGTAREGLEASQRGYHERLSSLREVTAPDLAQLREGLDESREAVAEALAALTAMCRQLQAEKVEAEKPS